MSSHEPALLLVGPRALQTMWLDAVGATGNTSFDFTLTDASGH
jgi:hypothetical protein